MLVVLLPVVVVFLLPAGPLIGSSWPFWVVLLLCAWVLWEVLGPAPARQGPAPPEEPGGQLRMLHEADQPQAVRDVMNVNIALEEGNTRVFRGRLRESASDAYRKLEQAFAPHAMPLVQEDEQLGAQVVLLPRPVEAEVDRPVRPWIHWLLFTLTLVTTTWAGAAHQGVDILRQPGRFAVGLPYALGLLAILGTHELGHYFMARRRGMRVTPPYFIPLPFALGTFGAFIEMRTVPRDRRTLFDVAVAGPLAGLALAVPALLLGLRSSTVVTGDAASHIMGGASVGSSILLAVLSKLSLGEALRYGHLVQLSPLAFAGWLGLMITALNLLPVGQLDGGHIAYAMFGRRVGNTISNVAMWSLLLLGVFVWPGLLMWAVIVFFIAGRRTPPLNDLTPVTPARQWLGYVAFVLLALIVAPLPHAFWAEAGIHCPYV
ncbi:MAG: hypothetical protein AMXMBFR13_27850 [Phycisphaerae bacterium]